MICAIEPIHRYAICNVRENGWEGRTAQSTLVDVIW